MYDASLRSVKGSVLKPITVRLTSLSPLLLTVLGLASGVLAALFAAAGHVALALGLWLLNRLLDGLDGELARFKSNQSDLGGYVDLLADLMVYALVPIGLAWSRQDPIVFISLALMLAAFYVNAGSWMLLSALMEKRGQRQSGRTSLGIPTGLIEGGETFVLFTLFFLFPQQLALLFGITGVLVAVTAAQRLIWASRWLSSEGPRHGKLGGATQQSRPTRTTDRTGSS